MESRLTLGKNLGLSEGLEPKELVCKYATATAAASRREPSH